VLENEQLGWVARTRASAERKLVPALLGSPVLRARLATRRASPIDGRTLDPYVGALLRLDDFTHGSALRRMSVKRARLSVAEQILVADAAPPPGVATSDHAFRADAAELGARVYVPEGLAAPSPAIAFIHGGGWVTCSIETHDALCRRLALGASCRVVSLEYRRAPEHRFPVAVADVLAGVAWIFERASELGVDPARVAVAGDSAGGNLSAVVSLRMRGAARRPALQVLLYAATDATCSLPSHQSFADGFFLTRDSIRWYRGHYVASDTDLRHPDLSPLFAPDVADVAPALVYTAGFDPLRDEGAAYAKRLSQAGVRVVHRELSSLIHGFALMTRAVPAAAQAVDDVAQDIARELG
jgi:acetyl esterase/lipase